MALTIDASGMTTISSADSTTGWTGPTISVDPEVLKEGTNSIAAIVRNNGTTISYAVTNQNYSGQHLRLWVTTTVSALMNTSGKTGLRFYVTSGGATAYWNIADKSTYSGGWINIVVDVNNPDTDPSSADMTSVDRIGIEFGLTASFKEVENTWIDYLRYGDGYTGYGTSWGFAEVATADASSGFGVVVPYEGIYFMSGNLQIGRATEQTTFTEQGAVISFTGAPVSSTLYGIRLIGQSTSVFSILGNVFTTDGQAFYLDFDDTGILDLTFNGNTVQGASTSHFRANATQAEVLNNTWDGSGVIYPQGSKFERNIISNTTVTGTNGSLYITDTATWTNAKRLTFNEYTGKYAVHIPASITGTITMDAWLFDGTGTDVYWAGTSGTLTVNLTNGSDASTYSSAGGTVVFASSNALTLTGIVDNTEVRIYTSDLSTELYGVENTSGGTVVYNYSGSYTNAVVVIHNIAYEPIRLVVNLGTTNSTIPIQQRADKWYKNP